MQGTRVPPHESVLTCRQHLCLRSLSEIIISRSTVPSPICSEFLQYLFYGVNSIILTDFSEFVDRLCTWSFALFSCSHRVCVLGVIVTTHEGNPIHSTFDTATTTKYASVVSNLSDAAKAAVRELDSANDLTFLRYLTFHLLRICNKCSYVEMAR